MVSIIKEDWSFFGGLLPRIIYGKFNGSQMLIPIILGGMNIMPQHVFQSAICTLCLTISLRMEGSGHGLFDVQ